MPLLLKWKIWRIESRIRRLLVSHKIKPKVWSFGAYYIDPKYLVFVVGVSSDIEKHVLKSNSDFLLELKNLLKIYNWPIKARESVIFDIESQETVSREANGNWWYHYK